MHLTNELVPVIVCAAQIQLLLWIVIAQNIPLTQDLVSKIIYQTEKRVGHSFVIRQTLVENPHMLQIDKYAEVLIDVFG